ncbi:DUF192 domain-containing protein [Alphaproteobacteria bacterium]|nr:DUF192 domain-containing protein [Alphaproteobacteria bacterium]
MVSSTLTRALLLLALVSFGQNVALAADDDIPGNSVTFSNGSITLSGVTAAGGQISIPVEFALSHVQRQQGLMHRRHLDDDKGMLFVFEGEDIRAFWMKNTLIPLDIIYFNTDGVFVSMVDNVPPKSLTARLSEAPARYVLELNAGKADRLGIGPATRLQLPVKP